jgi:hypothetical protein
MASYLSDYDVISPQTIQAANPGGIPQAVSMPGSTPYTIAGATLSPGTSGNLITSGGQAAPLNTSAAAPTSQASVATPSTVLSSAPSPGSLADYFARGIIVILGFIFIAVGLNMLRPGTVPLPRG